MPQHRAGQGRPTASLQILPRCAGGHVHGALGWRYDSGCDGFGSRRQGVVLVTMDMPARAVRGLLPSCLLLLLSEQESHGYEIVVQLKEFGFDWDGRPGPTYGELRKLERAGLLSSVLEVYATGPARRVYRLTTAGEAALQESADEIARLMRRLQHFTDRYGSMPQRSTLRQF